MDSWQPKRGDRVMFSDQRWATLSNDSKRSGRRGGVVTSVYDRGYGTYVNVRWDGCKTAAAWTPEELCPDDPAKHSPLPKVLREQAKAMRVKRIKGWQPIETAPRDGTEVLVWCSETERMEIAMWFGGEVGWSNGDVSEAVFGHPTHWMPLPAPPEDTRHG